MSVASLVPDRADTTLSGFAPACAAAGSNAVSAIAATASTATRPDDAIGDFCVNILMSFPGYVGLSPGVGNCREEDGFLMRASGSGGIRPVTCRSRYKG